MGELSNINSIEQYRKKKKRKKRIIKIVIAAILIILAAVGIFVINSISKVNSYEDKDSSKFPVNVADLSVLDLNTIDSNIIVTTNSELCYYTARAKKITSFKHGCTNPVSVKAGQKILTYDLGGYTIRLDNKSGNSRLDPIKTDEKILMCKMNDSNYIAVVTEESRYKGSVTVFDKKLNKLYVWHSAQEYIMSVDFIDNNDIIVATQNVENGDFLTSIYKIDINKQSETLICQIPGSMALDISVKSSDNIMYAGDNTLNCIDKKGKVLNEYALNSSIDFICNSQKDYTVIALSDIADAQIDDILVFDEYGRLYKETSYGEKIVDIYCDNDGIIVVGENNISAFNYELESLNSYENTNGYNKAQRCNDNILVMGNEFLQLMD